jgi:hypothetical protein
MEGEARRRPPIIYPSLSPSARRELRRRRRRTIRSTVSVHPSPSTLVCVRFRLSPSCSVTQSNVSCPSLSVCDHPIPSDPSPHPRPSTTCLTCYSSLTPSISSLPQPSQPLSLDLCLLPFRRHTVYDIIIPRRVPFSFILSLIIIWTSFSLQLQQLRIAKLLSPLSLLIHFKTAYSPYSFLLPYRLNHLTHYHHTTSSHHSNKTTTS